MFLELGEKMGAISHIVSFWRYRFPPGRPAMIDAEELATIFQDFTSGFGEQTASPAIRKPRDHSRPWPSGLHRSRRPESDRLCAGNFFPRWLRLLWQSYFRRMPTMKNPICPNWPRRAALAARHFSPSRPGRPDKGELLHDANRTVNAPAAMTRPSPPPAP